MRPRTLASLVVVALLSGACGHSANDVAGPSTPGPVVFPSNPTLGLGKHRQFEAPLYGRGPVWSLSAGVDGGFVSPSGMYYAPRRAPADTTIGVVATVGPLSSSATVHLKPGPADSLDCLAEGQGPNEFGTYAYADELPEAIVKVLP